MRTEQAGKCCKQYDLALQPQGLIRRQSGKASRGGAVGSCLKRCVGVCKGEWRDRSSRQKDEYGQRNVERVGPTLARNNEKFTVSPVVTNKAG